MALEYLQFWYGFAIKWNGINFPTTDGWAHLSADVNWKFMNAESKTKVKVFFRFSLQTVEHSVDSLKTSFIGTNLNRISLYLYEQKMYFNVTDSEQFSI